MMAEPTGAKTFADLITDVARFAGLAYYGVNGDEEAMIPVDRHDLFTCKQIVNEGIRRFIGDAPKEGWRWQRRKCYVKLKTAVSGTASGGTSTTLVDSTYADTYDDDYFNDCIIEVIAGTGRGESALVTDFTGLTCTFTFSGGLSGGSTPDSTSEFVVGHRYILPQDFGGDVGGPIRYVRDSDRGIKIEWTSYAEIAAMRENVAHTSYPYLAAVQPFDTRRWELTIYPDALAADTLEFPYLKYFDELDIYTGTASAAGATSITDSGLAYEFADDYFNDWIITVISGTGKGGYATVSDYTGSSGKFDFTALSNAVTPDTTTRYKVEPTSKLHPAGPAFDTFIRSACLAQTEQELEDVFGGWEERYQTIDLFKAHEKDRRSAPRKLGKMTNGKSSRVIERTWKDVTSS
jgi:hypothetical protein